jgi:hypothetical protein
MPFPNNVVENMDWQGIGEKYEWVLLLVIEMCVVCGDISGNYVIFQMYGCDVMGGCLDLLRWGHSHHKRIH